MARKEQPDSSPEGYQADIMAGYIGTVATAVSRVEASFNGSPVSRLFQQMKDAAQSEYRTSQDANTATQLSPDTARSDVVEAYRRAA